MESAKVQKPRKVPQLERSPSPCLFDAVSAPCCLGTRARALPAPDALTSSVLMAKSSCLCCLERKKTKKPGLPILSSFLMNDAVMGFANSSQVPLPCPSEKLHSSHLVAGAADSAQGGGGAGRAGQHVAGHEREAGAVAKPSTAVTTAPPGMRKRGSGLLGNGCYCKKYLFTAEF